MFYELRNVQCSYDKNKVVLKIDELIIPKDKIIFIVGVSGSGKSTILETLGMMNNTLMPKTENSVFRFYNPFSNDAIIDMYDLWTKGDKTISLFRQKFLSFIFQNTNLMPNLTAYENIIITSLIQGQSKNKCLEQAKIVIKELELEEHIGEDTLISNLSGGQRQRIAFARAITTDFTVLFGDEPTGNLDHYNSRNLMNVVKKEVDEIETNKTAIVVSHDIDLALDYAEQIVFIEKMLDESCPNKSKYGVIGNEFTYKKSEKKPDTWANHCNVYTKKQLSELLKNKLNQEKNKDI